MYLSIAKQGNIILVFFIYKLAIMTFQEIDRLRGGLAPHHLSDEASQDYFHDRLQQQLDEEEQRLDHLGTDRIKMVEMLQAISGHASTLAMKIEGKPTCVDTSNHTQVREIHRELQQFFDKLDCFEGDYLFSDAVGAS